MLPEETETQGNHSERFEDGCARTLGFEVESRQRDKESGRKEKLVMSHGSCFIVSVQLSFDVHFVVHACGSSPLGI